VKPGDTVTVDLGGRTERCIIVDMIDDAYVSELGMPPENLLRVKVPGVRKFVVINQFQVVLNHGRV